MKEVYQAPVDIAAEKYPILEVVYRRKRVRVESLYQMFPEEHVDEYIAVLHRLMLVRRNLDVVEVGFRFMFRVIPFLKGEKTFGLKYYHPYDIRRLVEEATPAVTPKAENKRRKPSKKPPG